VDGIHLVSLLGCSTWDKYGPVIGRPDALRTSWSAPGFYTFGIGNIFKAAFFSTGVSALPPVMLDHFGLGVGQATASLPGLPIFDGVIAGADCNERIAAVADELLRVDPRQQLRQAFGDTGLRLASWARPFMN
jgi:hypothetical protein